jgi:hypothetical protein
VILDADGDAPTPTLLLFARECLERPQIRRALVEAGLHPRKVVFWLALTMRAAAGVPARPPSYEEPRGYPGREREPLPEEGGNSLAAILAALVENRDVRRLVAGHMERTHGFERGAVMAQLLAWKDEAKSAATHGTTIIVER